MTLYPRAARPNVALDLANVYAADLGAPALAVANRFVVSVNMANGEYTIANPSSADGLARNVVATITAVTGNDTPGSILITGTDANDQPLTETLALVAGGTATGVKAFKTVTSIVQSGWVINTGNDTIVIGTGNLVGLPAAVRTSPAITASTQIFLVLLGTAPVAITATFDATELAKNTINASAGTYDGTKRLIALIRR